MTCEFVQIVVTIAEKGKKITDDSRFAHTYSLGKTSLKGFALSGNGDMEFGGVECLSKIKEIRVEFTANTGTFVSGGVSYKILAEHPKLPTARDAIWITAGENATGPWQGGDAFGNISYQHADGCGDAPAAGRANVGFTVYPQHLPKNSLHSYALATVMQSSSSAFVARADPQIKNTGHDPWTKWLLGIGAGALLLLGAVALSRWLGRGT